MKVRNRHASKFLNHMVIMAILVLFSVPVMAQEADPMTQPDDTWISISGTVQNVSPDSFTLDYGQGVITVEMDDGDRDADAYKLLSGDKVTVNGIIDDDLYETRTIEASSVYVEKLGTQFFASAMDEEDAFVMVSTPVVIAGTVVQGTVTNVTGEEFTLDTGVRSLTVEVDEMAYNPLDEEGYQKIEAGDVVRVTGTMDSDLLEGRELVAETVTTLVD